MAKSDQLKDLIHAWVEQGCILPSDQGAAFALIESGKQPKEQSGMTANERENLRMFFQAIGKQLDGIEDILLNLENENHRLSQTDLYLSLLGHVRDGQNEAKALADYIDHATDENWKQQKIERTRS